MALSQKFQVITLTRPQSGKTTLVRATFPGLPYVSLEEPDIRQIALTDPRGFLANFPDGAILDEVQHTPDLFSYLQRMVDGPRHPIHPDWILELPAAGAHQPEPGGTYSDLAPVAAFA